MNFQTKVIDEARRRVYRSAIYASHQGALKWAKKFRGKIYFLSAKRNVVMYENGQKIL